MPIIANTEKCFYYYFFHYYLMHFQKKEKISNHKKIVYINTHTYMQGAQKKPKKALYSYRILSITELCTYYSVHSMYMICVKRMWKAFRMLSHVKNLIQERPLKFTSMGFETLYKRLTFYIFCTLCCYDIHIFDMRVYVIRIHVESLKMFFFSKEENADICEKYRKKINIAIATFFVYTLGSFGNP